MSLSPLPCHLDLTLLFTLALHCSGEVDLLLTYQWPASITQGLEAYGPSAAPPEGLRASYGCKEVGDLASIARPRYHFAAGEDASFARLPYFNRDLGVGIRVTRFVALGPMSGETPPPPYMQCLHLASLQRRCCSHATFSPQGRQNRSMP